MTHNEQQELMKKVQAKCPNWTLYQVNGYVHGVSDEDRFIEPARKISLSSQEGYAQAYAAGFADGRGDDAPAADGLGYRWWME